MTTTLLAENLFAVLPLLCADVAAGQVLSWLQDYTGNKEALVLKNWLHASLEGAHHAICLQTAIRSLAGLLRPTNYLEFGASQDWAMGQVCAEAPGCAVTVVAGRGACANADSMRREGAWGEPISVNAFSFYRELRRVPQESFPFVLALVNSGQPIGDAWYALSYMLAAAPVGGVVVFGNAGSISGWNGETPFDLWLRAGRSYGGEFAFRLFPQALVPFGVAVRVSMPSKGVDSDA